MAEPKPSRSPIPENDRRKEEEKHEKEEEEEVVVVKEMTKEMEEVLMEEEKQKEEEEDDDDDDDESDSDLDWGDYVVKRGYYRNPANLERYGFRPVWWGGEYPYDEIPEDIKQHLNEDGEANHLTLIGSLRSIAWLAGIDELVESIDSPAYTVEDRIEIIPYGRTLRWPLEQLDEEGLISPRVLEQAYADPIFSNSRRYRGWQPSRTRGGYDEAPKGVGDTPAMFPLKEITRQNRLQGDSGNIQCMKVTNNRKGADAMEQLICQQAEGLLGSGKLLFRGLTLKALKLSLAFFIPYLISSHYDNEFGPGIYTSDDIKTSLDYIKDGCGALMVFKNPDLRNSTVWNLEGDGLEAWVARWTDPSMGEGNRDPPPEYQSADFILGPLNEPKDDHRGKRRQRKIYTQLVAVSYKGCQTLADSLYMIIFIDP